MKSQEWFLIKKNWEDWMLQLSDAEIGQFIRCLYTGDVPEGMLGILCQSHLDEFVRVNEKRQEGLTKKKEAGKKGMESRWNNTVITDDNNVTENDNIIIENNNIAITDDNLQRQRQRQRHIQKQVQSTKTNTNIDTWLEKEFNEIKEYV